MTQNKYDIEKDNFSGLYYPRVNGVYIYKYGGGYLLHSKRTKNHDGEDEDGYFDILLEALNFKKLITAQAEIDHYHACINKPVTIIPYSPTNE